MGMDGIRYPDRQAHDKGGSSGGKGRNQADAKKEKTDEGSDDRDRTDEERD